MDVVAAAAAPAAAAAAGYSGAAALEPGPVAGSARLGSLVRLEGLPEDQKRLEGQLGQLVSIEEDGARLSVALLDGSLASVGAKAARLASEARKPGDPGAAPDSFDLLLGPRTPDALLAEELAMCLFEKGFCVLRLCQSEARLRSSLDYVRSMADDGLLSRLPQEVEEGYLGVGGRGKVFWLDQSTSEAAPDPLLESNDQTLSYLASLLQPFSADALGRYVEERTPALVSLSLSDVEEDLYPHPMADDRMLGDFLGTWRRGVVRAVHFMGPSSADVALERREPSDDAAASAPQLPRWPSSAERLEFIAPPNTVLLFRSECFTFECRASSSSSSTSSAGRQQGAEEEELLTMSASFLEPGPQFVLTSFDGDVNALRGAATGPPPPAWESVDVMHHHCRLASKWDDGGMLSTGLQGGTDTVVEIPYVRFDVNIYWCEDPSELMSGPPRTVQKHTSFVEGIDLFDNRYFEISKSEASSMDPLQRNVLEVGGNLLHMFGISKKDANRTSHHGGCSVGVDKDDYPTLPNVNGGGNNVLAIIANRFSFVFNMKGPNYVCDTACSASLTALHVAKMMLLERSWDPLEYHLALGTHLCLSPNPWIGTSFSQMVSPQGRCFTFNASANGYLRGEGTTGVLMKYGNDEKREAILRASSLGQDGKSASLTAPNGPSQEEMIRRAIREARITPPESTCWECHGTGTSLGDPIEVGAVRRTQIQTPRPEPLIISTAKSNIGHLEGGAAMGGIVKCVLEVMHAQGVTTLHCRQLNPHLESAAFDAFYATELVPFGHEQGHAQVSSFGFGGSNGHAIFWGRKVIDASATVEQLVLRRLAKMRPAEVRPVGDDPSEWESDLPDADAKPGDRWSISFSPDDPPDAPIKWVKDFDTEVDGEEKEEDEDVSYSITGNFNSWAAWRMDPGSAAGQRVSRVQVPPGGVVEFRFLRDGDSEKALAPAVPQCSRKSAAIEGPGPGLTNFWVARGEPGSELQVELLVLGGRYSVLWLKV